MSQQVVDKYEEERERWLETRNSLRALRIEKFEPDVSRSTSIRLSVRSDIVEVRLSGNTTKGVLIKECAALTACDTAMGLAGPQGPRQRDGSGSDRRVQPNAPHIRGVRR